MKTNFKVRYEAPEAQIFHVESEGALCGSNDPQSSEGVRSSYGAAEEI